MLYYIRFELYVYLLLGLVFSEIEFVNEQAWQKADADTQTPNWESLAHFMRQDRPFHLCLNNEPF